LRKRIFTSLYVFKNFKKLHKRSLEQVYSQIRSDHVDKCLLKDVCTPEDVIHFGALILKVRLQSKILRSKQNKISLELILKNIDFAIPSCFIDDQEIPTSSRRRPQYWAERIEEQYFKKKEFLDYSSEDAQERFLSGIGLYNIMFSSYYVLRKDLSDKRETERMSLMSRIAAQRHVGMSSLLGGADSAESSDNQDSDEVESAESARSSSSEGTIRRQGRKNQDSTIQEASSQDERSSEASEDSEEDSVDNRWKKSTKARAKRGAGLADTDGSSSKPARAGRRPPQKYGRASSLWSQISDDELLLAINMQGVQILDNSRRDRIAYHIDFEDILYVMGKGS